MSDSHTFEDQGAAPPLRITDALGDSPLRRLPTELRLKIFTHVLSDRGLNFDVKNSTWLPLSDGTPVSQALNLRATCRELRRETEDLFFGVIDIHVISLPRYALSQSDLLHSAFDLFRSIGSSLLPTGRRPRLIIWPLSGGNIILGFGTALDSCTRRSLRVLRMKKSLRTTFQLLIGIDIGNHKWAPRTGNDVPGDPTGTWNRTICNRDVPLSMASCVHLRLIFPVDDQAAALGAADLAYQDKLAQLEAHRGHRFCPVRVELDKVLESLKPVQARLRPLVEEITLAASQSRNAPKRARRGIKKRDGLAC